MNISRHKITFLFGIFILVGGIIWGINLWVENRVRSILDEKVEAGQLNYESMSVNILTNQAKIVEPHWKVRRGDHLSNEVRMVQVRISDFSFAKYLFSNKIEIGHVQLIKPEIIFYPSSADTLSQHQNTNQPAHPKEIKINNTVLIDGSLKYFKNDTTELTFSGQLPRVVVEDILIDSTTLVQSIPFQYGNYDVIVDSVFYRMSDLYNLKVNRVAAKNNHFNLDSLVIKSPYDKYEFQSHIPHEKIWADLYIPQTEIDGAEWDFNQDTSAFSASKISLTDADLYLYKDNRLNDNPYFKPLYSRLIRELPIKLDVDSIDVINAAVTFQLQTQQEPPPGNVYFRGITGHIVHVTNVGMNDVGFPRTLISADARFMQESSMHLDWSFDIDDPNDALNVSGSISRISEQGINYFITPTLNISAEGAIDQLAFNFTANNVSATGDMYIKYDALRINLLKKDGSKRKPWISAVLNFILKNKLDGPVEKKGLKVERIQTKSFWNYLWEMVKEGTLKSIN